MKTLVYLTGAAVVETGRPISEQAKQSAAVVRKVNLALVGVCEDQWDALRAFRAACPPDNNGLLPYCTFKAASANSLFDCVFAFLLPRL